MPPKLGTEAKAAWRRAVAALGDDAEPRQDALIRYVHAVEIADCARRQWDLEGRPLTHENGNHVTGVAPVLGVLMAAERDAAKFAAALVPKSSGVMGRPKGAVSAADRKAPLKVKLRSVR